MTEDSDRKIAELEQELFDERRERDQAQRRSAELFDRVDVWRKRAEDRTERIKKLEAERDKLRGASGWLRRGRTAISRPVRPVPRAPDVRIEEESREGPTPLLPGIRCVAAASSTDLRTALAAFDFADMDRSVSLMEPDVVLVDAVGFTGLDPTMAQELVTWASVSGRPPLVVTSDTPSDIARYAQTVISVDDVGGRFFSPSQWSPLTRNRDGAATEGIATADIDGFGPVAIDTFDTSSTRHLEVAAQGIPFLDVSIGTMTPDAARRAGVQYRRYAYQHHTEELERLFGQLLLEAPSIRPSVAGILISNRPDDFVKAIVRLPQQSVSNFEVVVGCHGFSSSVAADAIDSLSEVNPVTVLEFDVATSLGECLNTAIASTGADVIAKMDDDDHYGPAYLTDAIQALEYGGTSVVGKRTTFTYLESQDRTVVRRPGDEERISSGAPTGATLVWRRSLWEANPFAHRSLGEDVAFLRGARQLGHNVYVNSAYEFVYHRRRTGNTWQASDSVFLEGAEPAWDGDRPDRADVPDLAIDPR